MRDEDLIAELRALTDHLDVPEPADQRAAVRARISKRGKPSAVRARVSKKGKPRWRTWLIGVVVAVVGAVGAVEPARAGVIDAVTGLLRVAGIEVRTRPTPTALPATPSPLPAQSSAKLTEAQQKAHFPVRLPAALGTPDDVTIADPDATGAPRVVTLIYRGGTVRLDEFDGSLNPVFLKQSPDAQWVELGDIGLWFPTPHPITYVDRDDVEHTATARLAGPTLIWQSGAVTYRLEGISAQEEALAVARSIT